MFILFNELIYIYLIYIYYVFNNVWNWDELRRYKDERDLCFFCMEFNERKRNRSNIDLVKGFSREDYLFWEFREETE